jgi:aryl-alcohol dehydrogenase-like predicted oxidoreductase
MEQKNFSHSILGDTGLKVNRIGLSASYRPGKKTIFKAVDEGLNYFFCFGIDTQMHAVMRDVLKHNRENFVISSGGGNLIYTSQNLRKCLEKRLRQLKTDYLDIFLYLGVTKEKYFPTEVRDELRQLKEEGKVKFIGFSTHDRKLAGQMADEGALDVMIIRYNAAHRGAEKEIFPFVEKHNTGVISFTATRWRYLLRRPKGWPKEGKIPTAGECYRFVLSNPNVDVCMMAPTNENQLISNLKEISAGPLNAVEMDFMLKFGDAVYNRKQWFM